MKSSELQIYRLLVDLVGGEYATLDRLLSEARLKSSESGDSDIEDLSKRLEKLLVRRNSQQSDSPTNLAAG
jgi:hypothetical protein